ncbi:hypothetical protein [Stenomitos frigidus]|uniref:Uncharacterized protein n=1 Tax=Stenomitos frigidus ULC18 TaxID=2107698 RepID=A0A2T1E7C0_9CYAN|nr:hypothetical protein [Stenomitos frigidus]PSB28574.1 hypothetical protein C7B82_13145 [Stenomitos frigidus ULC18]
MTKFLTLEQQSYFMTEPLNTHPNHSKEADDNMVEPAALLEHTPHVPYEVRTEGPLTYFHYYFEEADATLGDRAGIVQKSSAKSLPNRYLVGAGIFTATALTGLAIADINKSQVSAKPNTPQPNVQQNSPKATDSTNRLNLIGTAVQPLQSNQPLWSNQLNSGVSKTPDTRLTPGATATPRGLQAVSSKRLATDQPSSLNTSSLGTRSQSLRLSSLSLPKAMGRVSVAQQPEPVRTFSQVRLPSKPVAPKPLQTVKPLPLTNPPSLPNATLPAANQGTPAPQVAGIASPETLAPQRANESTRAQAPAPTQTALPIQPMTQGNQRLETSLPKPVEKENASNPALSRKNAAEESLKALNTHSALPPSIQDLLQRSHPLPTDNVVTLIPLTQKAAEEVLAMNKSGLVTDNAGKFTILHLNPQDYQQAWLATNTVAQQPALMAAFPTYGFVDYQKRIIAVLDQKQPLQASLPVGMLTPGK